MRVTTFVLCSTVLAASAGCGGDDPTASVTVTPDGGGGDEGGAAPDAGANVDGGARSRLSGVWSVARDTTSSFGTTGPMTLSFPDESSGLARFLGKDASSAVTTCGSYVFAVVADGVVVLESSSLPRGAFVIGQTDADTITLTNDAARLTLTRVSGAPPVEECGTADVATVSEWDDLPISSRSRLMAVDGTLYFNTAESGDPLVGYSLATKELGPRRTYNVTSNGGVDRLAVAAASHDAFFGHCACGGSNYVSRFDATTNTRIVTVDTTALGARINVRFGEWLGADVVIGGTSDDLLRRNVLLTLNPETLELRSQRSILSGVSTTDIAAHASKLYALTETGVVQVGSDGTATKTYDIPALRGLTARGLASSGGKLYALVERDLRGSGLLELSLK